MARKGKGGLAYSTESCGGCGRPLHVCGCGGRGGSAVNTGGQSTKTGMPRDGVVRVERQTKGRKGKGVTVVHGVPLGAEELKALGKALKQRCGSGGTVKNGTIEIQGDHRDTVIPELKSRGWTVKAAGG